MIKLTTKLFLLLGPFLTCERLKNFLVLQRAHRQKANCGPLLQREKVESLGVSSPAKDLNLPPCYLSEVLLVAFADVTPLLLESCCCHQPCNLTTSAHIAAEYCQHATELELSSPLGTLLLDLIVT